MRIFKTFNELSEIDKKFILQADENKELSLAEDKKVGAIIGNHLKGKLISIGYNKMFDDLGFQNCEDKNGESLPYVIHAEESAVIEFLKQNKHKTNDIKELTVYCSYAPCISCCKYISHLGIKRIVFNDKHLFKFDNIENSPMEFLNLMGFEVIEVIEEL